MIFYVFTADVDSRFPSFQAHRRADHRPDLTAEQRALDPGICHRSIGPSHFHAVPTEIQILRSFRICAFLIRFFLPFLCSANQRTPCNQQHLYRSPYFSTACPPSPGTVTPPVGTSTVTRDGTEMYCTVKYSWWLSAKNVTCNNPNCHEILGFSWPLDSRASTCICTKT